MDDALLSAWYISKPKTDHKFLSEYWMTSVYPGQDIPDNLHKLRVLMEEVWLRKLLAEKSSLVQPASSSEPSITPSSSLPLIFPLAGLPSSVLTLPPSQVSPALPELEKKEEKSSPIEGKKRLELIERLKKETLFPDMKPPEASDLLDFRLEDGVIIFRVPGQGAPPPAPP
jgi:hypothetical protein